MGVPTALEHKTLLDPGTRLQALQTLLFFLMLSNFPFPKHLSFLNRS